MRKLVVAGLTVALGAFVMSAAAQVDHPEYTSIVRVEVTHPDFKGWMWGTGFFVTPDTILTAAHVVSPAIKNPANHVLALWTDTDGTRRYFKLDVVCSTPIPPGNAMAFEEFQRDVAVLKASPVPHKQGWFETWGFQFKDGTRYDWTAIVDSLPSFVPLPLADGPPSSGKIVHLPGFASISPIPRLFESDSEVESSRFVGGTTIITMKAQSPDTHGGSGGPILDDRGQVTGMYAWGDNADAQIEYGEAVDALHKPCGSETF
jgi:hypothetical protein